eukprot:UN12681
MNTLNVISISEVWRNKKSCIY